MNPDDEMTPIEKWKNYANRAALSSSKLVEIAEASQKLEELLDGLVSTAPGRGTLTFNLDYPFEVRLDQIPDHRALVDWIHDISRRPWMHGIIPTFIERVCRAKGWPVPGSEETQFPDLDGLGGAN